LFDLILLLQSKWELDKADRKGFPIPKVKPLRLLLRISSSSYDEQQLFIFIIHHLPPLCPGMGEDLIGVAATFTATSLNKI